MTAIDETSEPTTSELIEGVLFYPVALVVSATIFPGLTLCIPGLIFVAVLLLLPIVAVALVLAVAGAIIAAPILLVRHIRRPRSVPARVHPVNFGRPTLASAATAHMEPAELQAV